MVRISDLSTLRFRYQVFHNKTILRKGCHAYHYRLTEINLNLVGKTFRCIGHLYISGFGQRNEYPVVIPADDVAAVQSAFDYTCDLVLDETPTKCDLKLWTVAFDTLHFWQSADVDEDETHRA